MQGAWLSGVQAQPKPISEVISEATEPVIVLSVARYTFAITERVRQDSELAAELCLVGRILYRDDTNVTRETGFFRIYSDGRRRFIPSGNSDEEYQD